MRDPRPLDPYWRDVVAGIDQARRNLNELQATGYPTTTPANGSPGGSSDGTSSVERLVTTAIEDDRSIDDIAAHDLARLNQMMDRIIPNHRELRDLRNLIVKWNYLTPGDCPIGQLARTAKATETSARAETWCGSCARRNHASPVHRAGRCRWCGDFLAVEGIDPPLSILELHHHGRRISQQAVKAAVREEKRKLNPPPPKKTARKTRSDLLPPKPGVRQ